MQKIWLFVLTLLLAAPASASQRLAVGDALIDPGFMQPYSARFELQQRDADGNSRPDGYWTDEMRVVEQDGQRLLRREVAVFDAQGQRLLHRINLADAQTLAPVTTDQRGPDGAVLHMDFADTRLRVTKIDSHTQPAAQLDLAFPQPALDLSLWAPTLASLPLTVGASYEIPVLGAGGTLAWETVTVEAEEDLTLADGGKLSVHRVRTATRPWTAWINKQHPPYLFRVEKPLPDNQISVSTLAGHDPAP